ncbi:MAG: MFS transporter [Crocinitomicaceae bacterium]|nr:MFS transporter [Crocinitomicaceae bacterium]
MFLFMTSFNLILPELNDFITHLGGKEYKGLIISLFTISAAISRPFSGKIADTVGRKSTMYIGTIICIVVTFLYPLSGSITFFLFLRFMHGFSTGFLPTGATALITDILPPDKRGQGMGVFGTGISLGIGVGQFLGTPITQLITLDGLFFAAGILAMISILMVKSIKETLVERQSFNWSIFRLRKDEFFEVNVLPVAMVMYLSAACSGILFVLSPDLSSYLGIENKGWFFMFYVISTISVRLTIGKLSDKIGRRKSLIIGMGFLIISMLMVAYATDVFSYTAASIVFGVATGINSPTLFAWMADLSPVHRRGIGSGTLFISLELGILFGSASTLFIYDSTYESVFYVFLYGASLASLAMTYLIWHLVRR